MKCSKKWSLLFIKQPHLTNEKRERIKIYFAFSGGIPYQHNQADEVKLYITDDHQAITIKGVEELKKKKRPILDGNNLNVNVYWKLINWYSWNHILCEVEIK